MKIIFLSFSDFKGGASIAAYSIYKSLNNKKYLYLTANKKKKDSIDIFSSLNKIYISILRILEKILIFFFLKKKYHQSLNVFNSYIQKKIASYCADIINVHWINRSMISLTELNKFNEKIVISLHDMWFFNSTQHYFEKREIQLDFLSKYCWDIKKKLINKKNIFFIVHNNWMLNQLKNSYPQLKKKIFISKFYPINIDIFKPRNKTFLRKKYNIPQNRKIILFSAQDMSDERKGFMYFKKIVESLSVNKKFFFISLGKSNLEFNDINNYKHFDFLPNEKTSEIYSLSDIYICTSVIDNLPLTILEALSSGNLVFSFKNGGSEEVLKKIGYTFNLSSINKMIKFINNLDNKIIKKKSIDARKFAVKNFNIQKTKKQYLKIFKTINNYKLN